MATDAKPATRASWSDASATWKAVWRQSRAGGIFVLDPTLNALEVDCGHVAVLGAPSPSQRVAAGMARSLTEQCGRLMGYRGCSGQPLLKPAICRLPKP